MEQVVSVTRRRRRFNFRGTLCIPYFVFMCLFVIFPLTLIVYYAFTDENGIFTFTNWGTVFTNTKYWTVILQTILLSAISTIVCVLIAYPIAYLLSNKKFNKNKVLVYIFLLPMWINFVIRTIGLKALINNTSMALFNIELTSDLPFVAIVFGMVYDYLPFAILPLYNQMLKMDKNQIEAAADLGANPARVFFKTIIPMTVPGIVSACMMTFMPTMSSYVIANKMSENTTSIIGNIVAFWFNESMSPNAYNIGSVISLLMLMIIAVSLVFEKVFSKKEETEKKGGIW